LKCIYCGAKQSAQFSASAWADHVALCKAHKVVHTKARSSLLTSTVQMLLFTYCNLRLLNDDDEPPLAAGPLQTTAEEDAEDDAFADADSD